MSNEVVFDFKSEMQSYCHSDVQLLRIGMTKFRDLFKNLQNEFGRSIGVDPYNHLTIAGVAFKGIYCKYFLPAKTIGVVFRPVKSNYSVKQILWLEYEMNKSYHYIHHARNCGEQKITLLIRQGVLVDGFCMSTITVYQFHGCFHHG